MTSASPIDTTFNMYRDSKGRDPDSHSPTLRSYHQRLWSKPLPNGQTFELRTDSGYLHCGRFLLGSDAITHSYRDQRRKKWLTEQIPVEVQALFDHGSTVGAYTVFPKNKVNGCYTLNQARGCNSWIDDRFDLTLECIRRFYSGEASPLSEDLERYRDFFELFVTFDQYVEFFLLNDLVGEQGQVKFYLPFDGFKTKPEFKSVEDYTLYAKEVHAFINARNSRIAVTAA